MKINSVAFGTAEPLTLIRPYPPPKGSGLSGSIGKKVIQNEEYIYKGEVIKINFMMGLLLSVNLVLHIGKIKMVRM